ncbi:unnamed protein product [Nesidiocoris tenuis]|uniref:Chaoptin n=1 Tax=Nesidiocoris tenuis TaxID=355587 RepID=A0A6H5HA26_9HEMI|nr:unnamed protein product [Nesidiocoris tenuis]
MSQHSDLPPPGLPCLCGCLPKGPKSNNHLRLLYLKRRIFYHAKYRNIIHWRSLKCSQYRLNELSVSKLILYLLRDFSLLIVIMHYKNRAKSNVISVLRTSAKVMRFLDLSYNKLENVPQDALRHLKALDWLNLHGNNIYTLGLELDWGSLRHTLSSIFLGENDLRDLGPDSPLAHCKRLQSVSLDSNKFLILDAGTLPPNVHTLSASHNIIKRFPVELLDTLRSLSWLYLRDNYIETVTSFTFKHHKNLDKVDLGDNLLTAIPLDVFNNTVTIRDLNLDYNYFKTLPAIAFKGLKVGRVSISMNRLETINERAFEGVENYLEYLDFGGNRLQKMPRALGSLTRLKYLYIPSNNLSEVQSDAFTTFAESLSALSIARNKLEELPSLALKKCTHLAHLNLGYNFIREVNDRDFVSWAGRLDTLLLMNNRLGQIHAHTFKHTPILRELSLSFNKIAELHPSAFIDVATSLENLEISFGLYQEDFPDEALRPLGSLMWLALDNNNFRTISEYSLRPFRYLRYLNLDGNRLPKLPIGIFNPEIHKHLSDIRISYNHLQDISSYMFDGLEELRALSLVGNQIRRLEPNAFKNLTNKVSILLSENKISRIDARAFSDIPYLLKLDLYGNQIQELSLSSFHNVTNAEYPMSLNLSKNNIDILLAPSKDDKEVLNYMFVHVVDLSFNMLVDVPKRFLEAIGSVLKRVNLGYNHITKLDEAAFGLLDKLEALIVAHNSITKLRKRAFAGLSKLQILDLSHNHIDQLHMEQFKHLKNLRVIDLSFNHLRSIPRDAFQNTKIERIDLSSNDFLGIPSGSLGEVGFTLRLLDISHNHIEHLDSTVFPETPHLTSLNLCGNRITLLPDNVFTSVGGLLRLDLCGNKLRANFKEVFHYLQELRHLNLANTGILAPPILPLPNLVSLNLSHNAITELPVPIVSLLPSLRNLDISHCSFSSVPSSAWVKLPVLKHLDISSNPIKGPTPPSKAPIYNTFTIDRMENFPLLKLNFEELVQVNREFLGLFSWPSSFFHPFSSFRTLKMPISTPVCHFSDHNWPQFHYLSLFSGYGSCMEAISISTLISSQ